jgi:predicted ATPase/DNA-binding SARP family transcriptional activator
LLLDLNSCFEALSSSASVGAAMVEFRLLGTLDADERGSVALGGGRQRTLLAYLLLHRNKAIPRETLIDALWPEDPPATAAHALDVYVSRLRKSLGADGLMFESRGGSIRLTVSDDAVDAARFEQLVAAARRVEDPTGRLAALDQALALWRGRALADLVDEPSLRPERERLEEERLVAEEERFEAMLALSRHDEAIGALQSLTSEHPLRERPRRLLMLALYRAGRQSEALEVYRSFRRLLSDELGLEPSRALQQLERAMLQHDPALDVAPSGAGESAARRAPHLPAAGSSLIGRRREVDELASLLTGPTRLVTVTGPGGIGKTRLALAAAEEVADTFAEGASFVSLAALRHERHVAAAVAAPLGVRDFDELDERETLLVLDNFEHLVAAAPVVSALLAAAPRSKALVTSRSPLRIAGEIEYPLAPLDEDDALALFVDRASAVRRGFEADDASREICRRLDCLPLALELAAPHLRSLRPAALLERLQPRLPLLSGGRRDAPERQRTLRAAIAWSYALLDPDLQTRFAHLSVFAGTFSLGAAEAVVGATFDQVERLVEASLVTPADSDRFFMLETIREFASEQVDPVDLEAIRADHADFFLALAEGMGLTIDSDAPMEHSRAVADLDNFRAALDWALATNRTTVALRLATALGFLWVTSDPIGAMTWFERLLAASDDEAAALRPRALQLYAVLTSIAGDWEQVERLAQQALTEARAVGDDGTAANALFLLATSALRAGDPRRAQALLEQSLALHRKTGSRKGEAQAHGMLGTLLLAKGEQARGLELIESAITVAHDAGFPWWEKNELCFLAEQLLAFGQIDGAGESAVRALRIATTIGDRVGQVDALAILAHVAAERNEPNVAGRLWGAVESEAARAPFPGWERTRRRHLAAIRAEATFEAARAEGADLPLDQAAEEMLHAWS